MGQQQLLLLVLGTVIVGLGVVAGIDAFNTNQKSSNQDALVNDGVSIASDAQAWMQKPAAYGGADNSGDWSNFSLDDVGYDTDANGYYITQNGTLEVTTANTDSLEVSAYNGNYTNDLDITVTGTDSDDISTAVN
jgi:hypothetical protein